MAQRLNSALIRNYVAASQKIELLADEERQRKISGYKNKRGDFAGKDAKKKKEKSSKDQDNIAALDQHKIAWDILFKRCDVGNDIFQVGLTSDQADKKNKEEGDNVLTTKVKNPWWAMLLHEYTQPFALMLWAGSALCFIAYGLDPSDPSNLYLGIVLAIVIGITGLVTFLQNAKSDSVMEGFKNFIPLKCKVLRDGKVDEIQASKLVTGDIIVVKNGEKIPADIRIIECKEMRVDNSSLTGESEPLLRKPECDNPEKILETKNVAFFGSKCVAGGGKGMVFNIGDKTIIGQIANLTESADAGETPLRKELNRFIALITIIALSLGLIFFCLGFVLKYGIVANLVFAIGIIVANVPEGLLATITITLSVASIRMQAKKVLVKNLESVETLGSTSCICSDKTGTLTQNKMTIENLFFDGKIVKGANRETFGKDFPYQYDINSRGFKELHECAIIGSEATFSNALPDRLQAAVNNLNKDAADFKEKKKAIEEEWKVTLSKMPYKDRPVNGDASETGIVKFFQPIQDVEQTRARFEIGVQKDGAKSLVPFGSEHKFALKVVRSKTEDSEWCVYLKGAPERVWDKCSKVLVGGNDVSLDKIQFSKIEEANIYFAKNGQRVLGLARYHLPKSQYPANHKFEFKGFSDLDIRLDEHDFHWSSELDRPSKRDCAGCHQEVQNSWYQGHHGYWRPATHRCLYCQTNRYLRIRELSRDPRETSLLIRRGLGQSTSYCHQRCHAHSSCT
jgi:sodium/potassium-transporting ATPase subunit alpha